MADEPEETSGGGLGRLMSRKVFGVPLPVVGAGVLGIAILAYRLFGSGRSGTPGSTPGQGTQFSSTTTSTDPNTGVSTSYSASGDGYLPGMLTYGASPMPYSGGDVYVNYPAQTNMPTPPPNGNQQLPDEFNPQGRDIGQYRYGADEIQYLNSSIGKYGLTQDVVNDVQKAYQAMVAKVGQQTADFYHYSYLGPGNVIAIPRGETNTTQTVTGLPGTPVIQEMPPSFGQPSSVQGSGSQYPGPTVPGQNGNYPPNVLRPGG